MEDNVTGVTPEAPKTDNPPENPDIAKRHAEQMAGSMAEVARLREIAVDAYAKQSEKDASAFLEVHSKDPKLANEVAKKLGYSNANEVLAEINSPAKVEDDFETKYSQKRAQEKHEEAIKKAEKILSKLPEELKEEAQKRFDRVTKGQMLDEETAIEFAEMATLYVNKDNIKAWLLDESLAMLGSTWIGKSKKVTEKDPQYVVRDGKLVLLSNN
jgi:tetratricopeptide (TPR) repeat protein